MKKLALIFVCASIIFAFSACSEKAEKPVLQKQQNFFQKLIG